MLGSFLLESDSHIIKIVANWRITNNSYCKLNTKTGVNWNSFFKKIDLWNTSGLLIDGDWRGSHVHAGRDWYPVYFEMDWFRYCEVEF